MNSKKKMIISISAFALVLISTVVSIVAVLAAQNVTIKNNLTVSYQVKDVAVEVTLWVGKIENDATYDWDDIESKTVEFGIDGLSNASGSGITGEAGSDMAEIEWEDLELTKTQCVIMRFLFINKSDRAFTITHESVFGENVEGANVSIYYTAADGGDLTSLDESDLFLNQDLQEGRISVAGGEENETEFYIRLTITDPTKNVDDYEFSFDFLLEADFS